MTSQMTELVRITAVVVTLFGALWVCGLLYGLAQTDNSRSSKAWSLRSSAALPE